MLHVRHSVQGLRGSIAVLGSVILRLTLLLSGAAAAQATPDLAANGEGAVSIVINCPWLEQDPEARAAFEARSLVELHFRGVEGRLTLACADPVVTLAWQRRGESTVHRTVLTREPSSDELLSGLIALVETNLAPPAREPAPVQKPVLSAPPPYRPKRWSLSAGVTAEAYSWPRPLSVGPSLGLGFDASRALRLELNGSWIGPGLQDTVKLSSAGVQLAATWALLSGPLQLELGAGLAGQAIRASAPAGVSPRSRTALALAPLASARAVVVVHNWSFHLGPDVRIYLDRPTVRLDGNEQGATSRFSLGASALARVHF